MSDRASYGKGDVSDTVLADIERRFTGLAVPEGTFDPSTATADQLMKSGFRPSRIPNVSH